MKKQLLTTLACILSISFISAQPATFSYQAVVRDLDGTLITDQQIILQLSVIDNQEALYYLEEHDVTTSEFGQIQVDVGGGTPISGNFETIPWDSAQLLLKTAISTDQGASFTHLGQAPLLAVPYALYSASGEAGPQGNGIELVSDNGDGTLTFHFTDGSTYTTPNLAGPTLEDQPGNLIYHDSTGWVGTDAIKIAGNNVGIGSNPAISRLLVHGDTAANQDDPIFEVKNKDGMVVFAVYQNGVEVNIDETVKEKGLKGGFAVGGLTSGKATAAQYFRVTPDSVRIYLKEDTAKALKGGFAVGGLTSGKGSAEYLRVTRDSTRVYVNDPVKGTKGGFAVGGLTGGKAGTNFLDLTPDNYFIGHNAGANTEADGTYYGMYNSFIGFESGYLNTIGHHNVYLGYFSGRSNVEGFNNVFIGNNTGSSNFDGYRNVFIGTDAGASNTEGYLNTFIGNVAGTSNINGLANTIIGNYAGYSNESGNLNVFIGQSAGMQNRSGSMNVCVGRRTGYWNKTGMTNTYIGDDAAYNDTISNNNVFVGAAAGFNIQNGNNNVFLGYHAGYNETGSNKLYISNSETNNLIYGDFDAQTLTFNGKVGIYNNNPAYHIDINEADATISLNGNEIAKLTGGTGIDMDIIPYSNTTYDIGNIDAAQHWDDVVANEFVTFVKGNQFKSAQKMDLSIDLLNALEPIKYTSDESEEKVVKYGFTIESLHKVAPGALVTSDIDFNEETGDYTVKKVDNPGINYDAVLPVVVNFMQQQQQLISKQQSMIEKQQEQINTLIKEVEKIKK